MDGAADRSQADVAEVRRLVFKALAGRQARVLVFGSRARGDATPQSDLDLAIAVVPRLVAGDLASLREALDEANVLIEVDIVNLDEAPPALRARILGEGVEWHVPTNV
jgi:uncharacterized protein